MTGGSVLSNPSAIKSDARSCATFTGIGSKMKICFRFFVGLSVITTKLFLNRTFHLMMPTHYFNQLTVFWCWVVAK